LSNTRRYARSTLARAVASGPGTRAAKRASSFLNQANMGDS